MRKTKKHIPPPNTYAPNYSLIENSKYKDISFGVGQRMAPLLKLAHPGLKEGMYLSVPES